MACAVSHLRQGPTCPLLQAALRQQGPPTGRERRLAGHATKDQCRRDPSPLAPSDRCHLHARGKLPCMLEQSEHWLSSNALAMTR